MRVMHVHAQDVMQAGAIRYGQSFSANIEVIRTDMARAEGLFTGVDRRHGCWLAQMKCDRLSGTV